MSAAAPDWNGDPRLAGLVRFAMALTTFNILGHAFLGFEQSFAQPLLALAVAYALELAIEAFDAHAEGRTARFRGGLQNLVAFLLPAHITGLAVAMLLYANDRLAPIAFAAAVAIGSKALIRVWVGTRRRHILNPSNFGISVTLLLFPWVGIAPPYQFTENLSGGADWALLGVLFCAGTFLNARFTKKLPLIAAWLGGFFAQAVIRSALGDTPLIAPLAPMTGVAFLLFTLYMVTDPSTTPHRRSHQVAFGLSVAAVYGVLTYVHAVFGLFFALSTVCILRGARLAALEWLTRRQRVARTAPVLAGAVSVERRQ